MIYLDHNASAPLLPVARAVWLEAEDRYPGNPSSPHRLGARADTALDLARQRLAAVLGGSSHDLVFTSGATEAVTTVLHHVAGDADPAAVVWVSAIEHPAVIASGRAYFGPRVRLMPVSADGVVDLAWVSAQFAVERPALVAVMAANNETGVLQPWRALHERCAAAGVPFFCDATQWCGRLPSAGLGALDFVAGSAHKFGGPRGVGFLKCPARVTLRPLLHGGSQQAGRRAGTENVSGVLAMLAALEWCEAQLADGGLAARLIQRERFERDLLAALPAVRLTGAGQERLWNTVNVIMPELDCRQRWVVKLDKAGFAVSTGSACASGTEHPSHVLTAMGRSAAEAARALRFSGGWTTSEIEWNALLAALPRLHAELAQAAAVSGER
ncbi:cysteine desulfurase family protein [Horticoccus sp. 23ND18S-11]|uniref:cysteine desulfurase family protein n=1 Tax=Horticoccus sp. 23ND18S-11 TaxID=3391832 RepID=UPI0039C9DDAC